MRINLMAAARARLPNGPEVLEYLGIIPAADLITAASLASLIGLSSGTRIDADWVKFKKGNRIRYVSKGPMRYGMSWQQIHAVTAVFGKQVTIGDKKYICRLLSGADTDPTNTNVAAAGGEFNELFYSICTMRDPSYTGPVLANILASNLGFTSANGFALFCKESRDITPTAKLRRNTVKGNIRTGSFADNTYLNNQSGWWPVLEEVI